MRTTARQRSQGIGRHARPQISVRAARRARRDARAMIDELQSPKLPASIDQSESLAPPCPARLPRTGASSQLPFAASPSSSSLSPALEAALSPSRMCSVFCAISSSTLDSWVRHARNVSASRRGGRMVSSAVSTRAVRTVPPAAHLRCCRQATASVGASASHPAFFVASSEQHRSAPPRVLGVSHQQAEPERAPPPPPRPQTTGRSAVSRPCE